jgi:hypothetical protein
VRTGADGILDGSIRREEADPTCAVVRSGGGGRPFDDDK